MRLRANQKKFVQWVERKHPKLYQAALNKTGGGLSGEDDSSWWSGFTESLVELGPAYLGYKKQKQEMDIELARAKAGLPPSGYPVQTPPVVRRQSNPYLMPIMIGGVALVAIFLLKKR
jgi:hypothetical protein